MHDHPRNLKDHIINARAVGEFIVYGLLSAALAYSNFLLFFAREGLSPVGISTHTTQYAQATILTYVTIVLCQFINLLFVRTSAREPFFSRFLWSNKKLLIAFAVSFVCILNIIYNPWVQPYFNAHGLSMQDWLFALGAAMLYLAIRLFHHWSLQHSRSVVLELHHTKSSRKTA
jgi:Ca2+-transporting ATPase